MRITTCPAAEELSAFNLGKLPEEMLQAVAEHLAECPSCQTALHALETKVDPLVAGLRQTAPEESYAGETEFQAAVERARALGREHALEAAGPPPPGPLAAEESRPALGRLREYQLLEKLGHGGMGVLYKALHTRLKRVVALKVLPAERMSDPAAVARFQREMEAVGRLNDPHIVRATDAGEVGGTHFLVMEFIEGDSLARLVQARGPLTVADACELVRQAAVGLQHVHEHGLVHRDVKPSNLLLSWPSGGCEPPEPIVKVLDLGLALLKEDHPGEEELTATGQVLGTFDFMAPEQGSDTHAVDIRADIYSLGCTLYFLLAGEAPFSRPRYPSRLSKMMAHAQAPVPPIQDHRADVSTGLAAVLARMLAKHPADRFATPAEVAAALGPFIAGCNLSQLTEKPKTYSTVPAREAKVQPGTEDYVSCSMTGTSPSSPEALVVPPSGDVRSDKLPACPLPSITGTSPSSPEALVVPPSAEVRSDKLPACPLPATPLPGGELASPQAGSLRLPPGEPASPQAGSLRLPPGELTSPQAGSLRLRAGSTKRRRLTVAAAAAALVAGIVLLSAIFTFKTKHGTLVLTVSEPGVKVFVDGEEKVTIDSKKVGRIELIPGEHKLTMKRGQEELYTESFTLKSGGETVIDAKWQPALSGGRKPPEPPPSGGRKPPEILACSPLDALRREQIPPYELAVAGGGDPKKAPPELVAILGDSRMKHWGGQVYTVAFSPDGKTLASGGTDHTVRLWDVTNGQQRRVFVNPYGPAISVVFLQDGRTLAAAEACGVPNSTIRFWDLVTGKEQRTFANHSANILSLARSPDGKTLASGATDKKVKLWDVATGQVRRTLNGHSSWVDSVAFSPDGKTLASRSQDGTVKVWDLAERKERLSLKGSPNGGFGTLAFSSNGKALAAGGDSVTVWDVPTGKQRHLFKPGAVCVAFSPDGKILASGDDIGFTHLWDMATGKEQRTLKGHETGIFSLAFSPDGKTLASASSDGTVKLWDPTTGQERLKPGGLGGSILSMAISPDGKMLATGSRDKTVGLWDVATGQERRRLTGHVGWVNSVAFSPDGKTLASGSYDFTVKLWDVTSGKEGRTLRGHQHHVFCVAFNPDGKTLASGSNDHTVKLWDVATGKERRTLKGHRLPVNSIAFSPDGQTLASHSGDGMIKLWNVGTGKERSTLAGPAGWMGSLAFSPDGKILASAGNGETTIKLWDVGIGEERRVLKGHEGVDFSVAFSFDGRTLASSGDDGTVRLWEPEAPLGSRLLRQTVRLGPPGAGSIFQVAFSPDGRHLLTLNGNGTIYVLRLAEAPGKMAK